MKKWFRELTFLQKRSQRRFHPSSSSCKYHTTLIDDNECEEEKAIVVDEPEKSSTGVDVNKRITSTTCTICQSKIKDITATMCGHMFCEGCIIECIDATGKCPNCRCQLSLQHIHPLFL